MDLVDRGIYTPIAIGMKGGARREASMLMLAQALSGGGVKETATESKSSLAQLKQLQSLTRFWPSGKLKRPSNLVTVSAATASAATASTSAASTSAASTSAEQPPEESEDCPSSSV